MRLRNAALAVVVGAQLADVALADAPPSNPYDEANVPPVRWEIDANQAVWWTWMDGVKSVVVNVGPFLYGKDGGSENWVRRWTFTIHMPGTTEPLSCVQGFFVPGDAAPLKAEGANFRIQLEPVEGLTWGDVQTPEDLVGSVEAPPSS